MEQVEFSVSSKTARLIGRENISDSNGAIIELVKNAYDADAENVYIKFNIIYESLPVQFSYEKNKQNFSQEEWDFILQNYNSDKDILIRKKTLSDEVISKLKQIFFSKNEIIIFDNGYGMNTSIIKTVWMNIGTNDKEVHAYSAKGRVKTGAKGIGRFALEKLSQITTVYSKKKDENLVYWSIDWKQFEDKKNLSDIKADLNTLDDNIIDIVSKHFDKRTLKKDNINIESGTLIILQGTRENWSEKIYERINNNLASINPFSNADKFIVSVNNIINPKLNYISSSTSLSDADYDYKITATYDGNEKVYIALKRNEVNLNAKEHVYTDSNKKEHKLNLDEFWEREAFKRKNYHKDDYDKEIMANYNIYDLLDKTYEEDVKGIGKFSLEMYFLKSGNSEYGFIKKIKVNRRKKLLNNFSGVKIYRDNFKVRPYGEDGPMFDWLGLGKRVQSNPAGVTHPTGSWYVSTYQLIGNVNISRFENPNLVDMANREGLSLNNTYYLFVELIQNIISKFEYDRQYVYREFGRWLKGKMKEIDSTKAIEEEVRSEKESNKTNENEHTNEEYKEAIYQISNEKKYSLDVQRILMNFSSSGIMMNTFAHEMNGIHSEFISRDTQMKYCLDYIYKNGVENIPVRYDPYILLDESEKNDKLVGKWIELIMDCVNRKSFVKEKLSVINCINEVKSDWKDILNLKTIKINIKNDTRAYIEFEKIDFFLIFNNLILNSAYFLEKEITGDKREINISFEEDKDSLVIYYENNGPKLDSKFENSPDIIFNVGETSKEEGTGLGMWICREVVTRNNGEINVVNVEKGFKIKIRLPKV